MPIHLYMQLGKQTAIDDAAMPFYRRCSDPNEGNIDDDCAVLPLYIEMISEEKKKRIQTKKQKHKKNRLTKQKKKKKHENK